MRQRDPALGSSHNDAQGLHVRLIDFGSALDAHSVSSLYGEQGPSAEEQTMEYAPPEALLGRSAACLPAHNLLLRDPLRKPCQHRDNGWHWGVHDQHCARAMMAAAMPGSRVQVAMCTFCG